MLRPIRRPAYAGPPGLKGGGPRLCNASCLVVAALALLAVAASLNYVTVERRRCAAKLDELEEVRRAGRGSPGWWCVLLAARVAGGGCACGLD